MKKGESDKIIERIETGYDQMAEKFSGTRSFFWPELEFLKKYAKDGDRIFDFGCGNGRLLEIFKDKAVGYFGVDISQKLIDLARKKYPDPKNNFQKISSEAKLDFPNDFFDSVFSLAVFSSFSRRDISSKLGRGASSRD